MYLTNGLACPFCVKNLETCINNSVIRWKCQKVKEELKSLEGKESRRQRLRLPSTTKSTSCLAIMSSKWQAVWNWTSTQKRKNQQLIHFRQLRVCVQLKCAWAYTTTPRKVNLVLAYYLMHIDAFYGFPLSAKGNVSWNTVQNVQDHLSVLH